MPTLLKNLIFFCALLFAQLSSETPDFNATVIQAEKLFFDTCYGEALPLYSELVALAPTPHLKIECILRLSSCQLEEKEPLLALALLNEPQITDLVKDAPLLEKQRLFLISKAYRQMNKSAEALNLLQQCSSLDDGIDAKTTSKSLIALEQGYHLMQLEDLEKAEHIFRSILKTDTTLYYELAQIELAKIYCSRQQFHEALQVLSSLKSTPREKQNINRVILFLSGWTHLALQNYTDAAACFNELLQQTDPTQKEWKRQTLQGCIASQLSMPLTALSFTQIESLLEEMISLSPDPSSYLFASDYYLIKAKCLKDPHCYTQARNFLDLATSCGGPLEIIQLKKAALAPSYQERKLLYQELLTDALDPTFKQKVWILKGHHDFEEGLKNQKKHHSFAKREPFEEAAYAFAQAIELEKNPLAKKDLLKYLSYAYLYLPTDEDAKRAWEILSSSEETDEEEILSLKGWMALRLKDPEILQIAKSKLDSCHTERSLKLYILICIQLEEWKEADAKCALLLQNPSYLQSHGEACFWRGYCADKQHNTSLKQEYFQKTYMLYPKSAYAPLAYFHLYSSLEYMEGKRKTIKHLQGISSLFPSHPLVITANYLMGLYHKKEQFSEGGQLSHKRDWTAAIDSFQLAESHFDTLYSQNLIPPSDLPYMIRTRYLAKLERAKANLAIGQHSLGGKKKIYLEYAEKVFKEFLHDLESPLARPLLNSSPYPKIWAEGEFQLAKTYEEKKEWDKAEELLNQSLVHYNQAHILQSLGLMQVWYAKGKIASQDSRYDAALECFLNGEKATNHYLGLNPNDKLDLWMQQSLCHKALEQYDQAMRLLSRIINENVASSLRIQAMFARVEIYEIQGRDELAIKQLEAIAQKGGEWGKKAQEKLENTYGYSFNSDLRKSL